MVDYRYLWPILGILLLGWAIMPFPYNLAISQCLLTVCCMVLMFHPTRVEIIAKGVGDLRGVQELNFEKWLEDKPKIVEAVKLARELSPDDFMTFISLLVEMRYKRDQTALEYVSRFFNRK